MFRAWWFLWRACKSLHGVWWLSGEARILSPSPLSELSAGGTGTTFPEGPALPSWAWMSGPRAGLTTAGGRTLSDELPLPSWAWATGAGAGLTRASGRTLKDAPPLPGWPWATGAGAGLTTAWGRTLKDAPLLPVELGRPVSGQSWQPLVVEHFLTH